MDSEDGLSTYSFLNVHNREENRLHDSQDSIILNETQSSMHIERQQSDDELHSTAHNIKAYTNRLENLQRENFSLKLQLYYLHRALDKYGDQSCKNLEQNIDLDKLELDINKKDELLIGANKALIQLNIENDNLKQLITSQTNQLNDELSNKQNFQIEKDILSKQITELEIKLTNYSEIKNSLEIQCSDLDLQLILRSSQLQDLELKFNQVLDQNFADSQNLMKVEKNCEILERKNLTVLEATKPLAQKLKDAQAELKNCYNNIANLNFEISCVQNSNTELKYKTELFEQENKDLKIQNKHIFCEMNKTKKNFEVMNAKCFNNERELTIVNEMILIAKQREDNFIANTKNLETQLSRSNETKQAFQDQNAKLLSQNCTLNEETNYNFKNLFENLHRLEFTLKSIVRNFKQLLTLDNDSDEFEKEYIKVNEVLSTIFNKDETSKMNLVEFVEILSSLNMLILRLKDDNYLLVDRNKYNKLLLKLEENLMNIKDNLEIDKANTFNHEKSNKNLKIKLDNNIQSFATITNENRSEMDEIILQSQNKNELQNLAKDVNLNEFVNENARLKDEILYKGSIIVEQNRLYNILQSKFDNESDKFLNSKCKNSYNDNQLRRNNHDNLIQITEDSQKSDIQVKIDHKIDSDVIVPNYLSGFDCDIDQSFVINLSKSAINENFQEESKTENSPIILKNFELVNNIKSILAEKDELFYNLEKVQNENYDLIIEINDLKRGKLLLEAKMTSLENQYEKAFKDYENRILKQNDVITKYHLNREQLQTTIADKTSENSQLIIEIINEQNKVKECELKCEKIRAKFEIVKNAHNYLLTTLNNNKNVLYFDQIDSKDTESGIHNCFIENFNKMSSYFALSPSSMNVDTDELHEELSFDGINKDLSSVDSMILYIYKQLLSTQKILSDAKSSILIS